ncbi:integrase [Pseudoalteromonas tetraodonis]|uniref:Integrase n=1 Tax=Pseudoalteromonas tetraodonis TaxID=43659 RepID=A0ABD4ERF0_9GAMM|nr:site-specific integrase [Pseudoalteromonas spiralis]KYL35762.1 integrase [Pseudoalteromonas spiralis]
MKLTIEKKSADSTGRQQLLLTRNYGSYLNENGKRVKRRKRQSLDLFIYATPKDKFQRDHNKKTLDISEKIRAQAVVDLANNKHHFEDSEKQQESFYSYMQQIINDKEHTDSKSNVSLWESALIHLQKYCEGNPLSFADFDADVLLGFRTYLIKHARTKSDKLLSSNTTSCYFNKVRAALNKAFHEGIIRRNPVNEVKSIKIEQNPRNYLEEEELTALYRTECRYDVLKRAFLFSCLTGMRWCDIHKLTWNQIALKEQRTTFKHKKTKNLQYLDLPDDAISLLGSQGEAHERVFKGLRYSSYTNVALTQWMLRAGITKHITFHCGRHSFAVRMLTNDIDIYTVSKLLGHSELKTTQIYSDIVERKRKEAMNTLPSLFQ